MKRGWLSVFGLILGLILVSPSRVVSQAASGPSKLEVRVNYTGSGTVDDKHKVFVVLWDSTDFVHGNTMPVEILSTSSKTGSVVFDQVQKSPAYVSTAFDPKGEWDGQSGPPPDGTSLGLYSEGGGQPGAIEVKPGKTSMVTVAFDDSVTMQGGQAHAK
jgi:hypothetical protein